MLGMHVQDDGGNGSKVAAAFVGLAVEVDVRLVAEPFGDQVKGHLGAPPALDGGGARGAGAVGAREGGAAPSRVQEAQIAGPP